MLDASWIPSLRPCPGRVPKHTASWSQPSEPVGTEPAVHGVVEKLALGGTGEVAVLVPVGQRPLRSRGDSIGQILQSA